MQIFYRALSKSGSEMSGERLDQTDRVGTSTRCRQMFPKPLVVSGTISWGWAGKSGWLVLLLFAGGGKWHGASKERWSAWKQNNPLFISVKKIQILTKQWRVLIWFFFSFKYRNFCIILVRFTLHSVIKLTEFHVKHQCLGCFSVHI